MNAALAFYVAHAALTGGRPERRRRRCGPRLPRALLFAAAGTALVLGTLAGDALASPARSTAAAQPGGDHVLGVASAKKKRSADKPGAKKRGAGKRRGRRRVRRVDLFYTAKITGTGKYEYTNDQPMTEPSDVEYTSPGSGHGGAQLRAAGASIQLHRELFTHPTTKQTIRYYSFEVSASGELSNGTSTDSGRGERHKYNASGCSASTVLGTEFGPSPIDLQVSGTLRLPGQGPRITASRMGPAAGTTTTYGSKTCTRPDGTIYQVGSQTLTGKGEVPLVPASCNHNNGPGGPEITSAASGKVAWGRAFTISVKCAENWAISGYSSHIETSLKIAMVPCPRRGTRPCQ